jgi:hypothetical protein
VVLGGALTGTVSLFRDQLATKRERDARQLLRAQDRQDRRDAFQRETLLALQDVVEDIRLIIIREYERKLTIWRQDHRWPSRAPADSLPKDWSDADALANKLWARVLDVDLASMVSDFCDTAGAAVTAQTQDRAFDEIKHAGEPAHQINTRIGVLLHDLF